jgi:hypothetical protein
MKSTVLLILFLCTTMMGFSQTPNNPKNVTPLDGKVFTDTEAKSPITFRWTPVTSPPASPITYKLRVWQLKQGQTGADAIKNNTPIAVKDVANDVQTTLANVVAGGCTLPNLCSFVWQVQATNRQGTVVGTSSPTSFTATLYIIQIDSMSVTCLDKAGSYSFYFKITNPNPGVAKLSNFVVTSSVPAGATITFAPALGTTIPAFAGSLVVTGTITGSAALSSICLGAEITDVGNSFWKASQDVCRNVSCPCNPCKDKSTSFGKDSISYTNGGVIVNYSTISHLPKKVIKVSAQIVDVERLGEAGCLKCTKESKEFGNFTSGTLNGNTGTIVNGGSGYGKDIQWQYTAPTLINNFIYDFQMAFPPLTEVSCCKDSIKVCTRWSFMDSSCVTCDTLICKVIIREYKKPSIIIHGGAIFYAEQMAKLGEPYNSWYKQEGNELPPNFNTQVQELYQRRQFERGEDVTIDVFTERMKQAVEIIRQLKLTSSDGIWAAIISNPINSQCGSGNFENGIPGISDWSGAYGQIGYFPTFTNDPIFGTYTSGFNPSVIGLDLPMVSSNQQTVVSAGNDPKLISYGITLKRTSNSSAYAFRIGNSINGYGSEILSKKFIVGANDTVIRFNYALVMNGVHGSTINPSFWVKVYDNGGNPISGCVYLDPLTPSTPKDNVVSSSTNPFFQHYNTGATNPDGIINYIDWTCAKIILPKQYIGQVVSVALISADCTQGGHWGYAYIDNWCGNCEGATNGVVNIQAIKDSCIKQTTKVCVNYTLPTIGTTTGTGTITLNFYQSGNLFPSYTLTSTPLTPISGTYCFPIDPTKLPCINGKQGFDVVATGNFSISGTAITVTSPDPVGSTGTVTGIRPGMNNDLVCCPAENCCINFKKTVTTVVSMVGTTASGFNSIKFVPTFVAGPKPIKKIVISIENFEITSSNKECLTCESATHNYGSMSVPQSIFGVKDPIEGMTYPTKPLIATCVGCPPTWTGYLSHSVTWGSNNGPGYNLMDGLGDQSTTFFVHLPKKSTLVCCDDTIKVCVKYSFTDTSCVTCDTVICYKIINRQIFGPGMGFINGKSRNNESVIGLRYKDIEETTFLNTLTQLDLRTAAYDLFKLDNVSKAVNEEKLRIIRDKPRNYAPNGAKY